MEDIYNLHRHTYCAVIYLGKSEITIGICSTSNRFFRDSIYTSIGEKARITYNKQKSQVLNWGSKSTLNSDARNYVYITDFINGLYQTFKRGKNNNRNDQDIFLMQAMSDFLRLKMKKLLDDPEIMIEEVDAFHYMFVAPYEWNYKEREDFFRPIFVQSGLISKDDHKDRLLFLSDLEAIFYYFQRNDSYIKKESFKRWERSLMCRITPSQYNNLSIKLDLIETQYSSFDFANSMLYPRVVHSTLFSVTSNEIKNSLKAFILAKIDFNDVDIDQNKKLQAMVNDVYENIKDKMDGYDYKNVNQRYKGLMIPWITNTKEWELYDNLQIKLNKPISIFDICSEIGKNILHTIHQILVENIRKKCELLVIDDQYSSDGDYDPCLFAWLNAILEYCHYSLKEITSTTKNNAYFEPLYSTDITKGAAKKAFEAIQNSDIHTNPCIIPQKGLLSSNPIFVNEKANAVISIGAFYEISDGITLKVDQRFISFVDVYSNGGFDPNLLLNDLTFKKTQEIEDLLNADILPDKNRIYTRQAHYIRAFLIIYVLYINQLVSNGIPDNNTDMKIGYIISIEKLLLDNTFSSKKSFIKLLFESGMIRADDSSKKLKVITQGEGLLPIIQKHTKLEFPIKSYFVIAQLNEDYVHLALNQAVTCPSINDEEEAIILQDKIIPIRNIYDSLCINMWDHIICHTDLIQFCDIHDGNDTHKSLDLFSLKARSTFLCSLKRYISDNILNGNLNLQSNHSTMIYFNATCTCQVYLSFLDIINISFKPVLQKLASIMSASLTNTDIFGNYTTIRYLFSLIHFNNNAQLHVILADLLKEEMDHFNEEWNIDTYCLVITKLSTQLLQPIINQKSFAYNFFRLGSLHRVSSGNYGFTITRIINNNNNTQESQVLLYKDKREDDTYIESDGLVFSLLKRGDLVENVVFNRIFYLKKQNTNVEEHIKIELFKIKSFDGLKDNRTMPLKGNLHRILDCFSFDLTLRNYKKDSDMPIMITIYPKNYASSFQFSVKEVGNDISNDKLHFMEAGEPITLLKA